MVNSQKPGVLRTAVFRRQHEELALVAADILALLVPDELSKDATIMAGHLSILSGKLTVHLAMEDKGLYPRLVRHPNAGVRDLAQCFMAEMGSIQDVFREYLARWRDPLHIQKQAARFVDDTRQLLSALQTRIAREDHELYAMVDREG